MHGFLSHEESCVIEGRFAPVTDTSLVCSMPILQDATVALKLPRALTQRIDSISPQWAAKYNFPWRRRTVILERTPTAIVWEKAPVALAWNRKTDARQARSSFILFKLGYSVCEKVYQGVVWPKG